MHPVSLGITRSRHRSAQLLTLAFIAVYVLDEIAQLASGGGEVAQALADATIIRQSYRSPIVKQKVVAHNPHA